MALDSQNASLYLNFVDPLGVGQTTTISHYSSNYSNELFKINYSNLNWTVTILKPSKVNGTDRSSGYSFSFGYTSRVNYHIVES